MESDASSEIHSAVEIRCPTGILKNGKQADINDSSIQDGLHKRPFKLRFGKTHDLGRSTVSSIKPLGLLPILTPKFYTSEAKTKEDQEQYKEVIRIKHKIDHLYSHGPREKLKLPQLESHVYGWYHNVKLSDIQPQDRRFNFGIHSSQMVKYRVLILATDRATQPTKLTITKTKV